MPAIPLNPSTRRLVHTRRVECMGFERSDGLFDIERRLIDTKGIDTEFLYGTIAAGGVLHQMRLVMTLDERMVIQHIEAHSERAPTPGGSSAWTTLKVLSTSVTSHSISGRRVAAISSRGSVM